MSKTMITSTGFAVSDPVFFDEDKGNNKKAFASIRFASTPRVYSTQTKEYTDGSTSWFDVKTYGNMAKNVANTIKKGDPILVNGTLHTVYWEDKDGNEMSSIAINAEAIGHNLFFGTSSFTKASKVDEITPEDDQKTDSKNPNNKK
jgi:single-strand DNA-binding protein